jgi:hypothetical protein
MYYFKIPSYSIYHTTYSDGDIDIIIKNNIRHQDNLKFFTSHHCKRTGLALLFFHVYIALQNIQLLVNNEIE